MSESDQQSFYEIQLDTSHLLLVFLGAVVVGVTLFYLGVVIGRGYGTAPALAGDWSSAAPVEGAAGDTEGAGDEELGFYEDIKEEPGGSETPASDPAATPGAAAGEPEGPEGTGDGDPPAPGAAAGEADTEAPGEAEPPTGPDPTTEATDPPAPQETGTTLPEADPNLENGWIIQVRSTTDRSQADTLTRALVADGYQAFVVSADIDGTTWYRVRVGRYEDRSDAELVEQRLARRGDIEQTWITEG